jgi:SOS response regulatory protein OraA/RecX
MEKFVLNLKMIYGLVKNQIKRILMNIAMIIVNVKQIFVSQVNVQYTKKELFVPIINNVIKTLNVLKLMHPLKLKNVLR